MCHACDESFTDLSGLLDHIRIIHPDLYPDTWPDGEIVVFDQEFL